MNQHVDSRRIDWRALHAANWEKPDEWSISAFVERNLGVEFRVVDGGPFAMVWAGRRMAG